MANFDDLASISSGTTTANLIDTHLLKQEYSKLKNKFIVLKKAYTELNESSKQKDQLIRKHEQELESITFRNQQLASRITILQNELSISGNTKQYSVDIQIMMEELNSKINENVILHKRIDELEIRLNSESTENQPKLQIQTFDQVDSITKTKLIEKLENDKIKLELKIIKLENEIKQSKETNAMNSKNDFSFNKSSLDKSNCTFDKKNLIQLLNEHVLALDKVHECIQDKLISINSSFLLSKSTKLDITNDVSSYIESFDQFKLFVESILINHIQVFSVFKVLQREELNNNQELAKINEKITNKIEIFIDLVRVLKSEEKNQFDIFFERTLDNGECPNLSRLRNIVEKILQNFNDLVKLFDEKLYLEHESCTTQTLLTMDECISYYLKEYESKTNEMVQFLSHYVDYLLKKPSFSDILNKNDSKNSELLEKIHFLKEREQDLSNQLQEALDKFNEFEVQRSQTNKDTNEDDFKDKIYYEDLIVDLKYQLSLSESKLICVYQELTSVWTHLQVAKDENTKFKQENTELNDELDVTRQRYEDQIRTMSDHIASINETLTQQAEKIENLTNTNIKSTIKKK